MGSSLLLAHLGRALPRMRRPTGTSSLALSDSFRATDAVPPDRVRGHHILRDFQPAPQLNLKSGDTLLSSLCEERIGYGVLRIQKFGALT